MLIELPDIWVAVINIVLWLVIHLSVAYLITLLPIDSINPFSFIFKERYWEKDGIIYESFFKVKKWKEYLPDGAALFKKGFKKKRLRANNIEYIERFILETSRAELVHCIVIIFSPIFFIWNVWWSGTIMIVYAILANLPCIIAQRYNRIRLKKLLSIKFDI